MPLRVEGAYLKAEIDGRTCTAAELSRGCLARLEQLAAKGYRPTSGQIRFIVAWKKADALEETAVPMIALRLTRTDAIR